MKQTIKPNQPRPNMTYSAHASTHGTSKYELLSVCLLMINISEMNELQGEGGGGGHAYNQSDGQAEITRQQTGRQGDLFWNCSRSLSPSLCFCLSVCRCLCLSLSLSVSLCVSLSVSVSVWLAVCPCVCLSVCLSVSLRLSL